jgi:2-hydroxychromene-2-carboxylate isomerase
MKDVLFFFDFVSPYSWLALMSAPDFEREHGVRFDLRPIVYAKVLEANGLLGPVEIPVKRRYTIHDIARCARRLDLRLVGPPVHPFRSLAALRVATLHLEAPGLPALCRALADAAWSRGLDLTQFPVLERIVGEVGLDARDLEKRAGADEVKEALRRFTAEAVGLGVFGVPSFIHEGRLFWGHDRMEVLGDSVSGRIDPAAEAAAERMLARPVGVVRKRT